VLGPAVVHQESNAHLHERRPCQDGNERFVLQLRVYDHQRDRVERSGRSKWIQNVQDVWYYMPGWSRSHHNDICNKRSQCRATRSNRSMLA